MSEPVTILARPHPISTELVRCDVEAGGTLREMIGPARYCRVEIGGVAVPETWWERVRPKPGITVHVTRLPQGGSVKSILRIVAFAALAVGVALISGGIGGAFFAGLAGNLGITATFAAGSLSAGLLAAGVGLVGALVINALIPPTSSVPSQLTSSTDTLRSITGTSNQANRFGVIPCVVGIMQMYPLYAAQSYTELVGDDQYLRCLFDAGLGNVDVSEMKIGDSGLETYTGVETEIGINPDLFSQDILEEPVDVAIADGDVDLRTTGPAANEGGLDLIFASGLFGIDSSGNVTATTCPLRIEFAPTGQTNWQSVANADGINVSFPSAVFSGDGNLEVNNIQRKAVRVGLRWKYPVAGQYDVRVSRYTTSYGNDSTDPRVGDLTWSVIRTIRYTSVSKTNTTKIALRIKATDQLSGNISQFSIIAAQRIPTWNGSAWIYADTENPAWIFRWVLTDARVNPQPADLARVDDEAIIAWAAECEEKEFTFSTVLDSATTIFAFLQQVCAAGRASFNVKDGKYSVVRDVAQAVPVQVFTPRNSDAFAGSRAFPNEIHGLRVTFTNPNAGYQQDEMIVYDDGYGDGSDERLQVATLFEDFPITGCTNANGAWRLARYHLACLRLRPNTYTWTADVENLVCNRGDLVHVANDVIDVGQAWGRIKVTRQDQANNADQIQTDEKATFATGTVYAVRIRRQDGTAVTSQVTSSVEGDTALLNLSTPLPNVNPGDLFLFGTAGIEVLQLVITKIESSADFAAKITAVDAAPAVLNADAGTPPAWNSSITGQPWVDTPEPPSGIMVNSSQTISTPDDAGVTSPVVAVTILQPSRIARSVQIDHLQLRYRQLNPDGSWTIIDLPVGQATVEISGVDRSLSYQFEARSVGANAAVSPWIQQNHTVDEATIAPSPVTNLAAVSSQDGILITWSSSEPNVDFEVWRSDTFPQANWYRISTTSNQSFDDPTPSPTYLYYQVRAKNYSGLYSEYAGPVQAKHTS